MSYKKLARELKEIAREVEANGKQFSADQQAIIRMYANSVVATVDSNIATKNYSFNEDD